MHQQLLAFVRSEALDNDDPSYDSDNQWLSRSDQSSPSSSSPTGAAAMRDVVTPTVRTVKAADLNQDRTKAAGESIALNGTSDLEELRHAAALKGVVAASMGNSTDQSRSTRSPPPRVSDMARAGGIFRFRIYPPCTGVG